MTEKRKMNDFRMNNLAYIQAGDYYIPDIRLQPIEEKGTWKVRADAQGVSAGVQTNAV